MMQDVSLHPPAATGAAPAGPSEMGVYAYEDDEDNGDYTPRRIWPADYTRSHRYTVRAFPIEEAQRVAPAPPPRGITANTLNLLTSVGLVIFVCSVASLVVVAMLMNSTQDQVNSAVDKISLLQGALTAMTMAMERNNTQLDRLVSLMHLWVSLVVNSTQA